MASNTTNNDLDEIDPLLRSMCDFFDNDDIFVLKKGRIYEPFYSTELACILKKRFEGWSVHVEYNRYGIFGEKKPSPRNNLRRTNSMRPDIIIHKPGTNNNLIHIEIKCDTEQGLQYDLEKIAFSTNQAYELQYKYGISMVISTQEKSILHVHIYQNGQENIELSSCFLKKFRDLRPLSRI